MSLSAVWEIEQEGCFLLLERKSCRILEDAYAKDPKGRYPLKYRKMSVDFDLMTYIDTETQELKKIRRSEILSPGSWQNFRDGEWKFLDEEYSFELDDNFQHRLQGKSGIDFDSMKITNDSSPLRRISRSSPPLLKSSERLFEAARDGNLPLLQELFLGLSVNVNWRDENEGTPLFIACREGKSSAASFLLGIEGLEPNLPLKDGSTPLSIACQNGHADVVALLLADERIDVDKPKEDESTPLWVASQNGHLSVVMHILASGRVVDTQKIPRFNTTTAVEISRLLGSRTEKPDDELEESFKRKNDNCPKIAELIDAYENNPDGTISRLRVELGSQNWTSRKRRQEPDGEHEREQELQKLQEIITGTGFEKVHSISKCSICLNSLRNPKTLPCLHSFCFECLENQTQKSM